MLGQKIKNFMFSAYNPVTDGFEEHRLAEYGHARRWLVLFFYPADFTFVCPTELADIAGHYEELQHLGVDVVSVSTDSKFSHLAWCRAEALLKNVAFLMASDPMGTMADFFGMLDAEAGAARRGTVIINRDSVLVGSEVSALNVGRNAAELVRKMQAYLYVESHPYEECPAAWEPGFEALRPSDMTAGQVAAFWPPRRNRQ